MKQPSLFFLKKTALIFLVLFLVQGQGILANDFQNGGMIVKPFSVADNLLQEAEMDLLVLSPRIKQVTQDVFRFFTIDSHLFQTQFFDICEVLHVNNPKQNPADTELSMEYQLVEHSVLITADGELKIFWPGCYLNTSYDLQKEQVEFEVGSQALNRFLPDQLEMTIKAIPRSGSVGILVSCPL